MNEKNSKELWLSIEQKIQPGEIVLGRYTTEAYQLDPIRLSFITSRYKFCARMLCGLENVLEIGCGDAFGSMIVAQMVGELVCTDINETLLDESKERLKHFKNVRFKYFDFRSSPYPREMDAVYLIDTIEHIYPDEEPDFMRHLTGSLNEHGVCMIGTPNATADKYANKWSRLGHVNLKDHASLMGLARTHFHNAFFFGQNDEMVHTGFPAMTHFMWALCIGPKRT